MNERKFDRRHLRLHYRNNFCVTRRRFLYTQIFSTTCPFHPSSSLTSILIPTPPLLSVLPTDPDLPVRYHNTPPPPPHPTLQSPQPLPPSSISDVPDPSNSVEGIIHTQVAPPLLKSIGNQVRKLRDSVSSTITAAAAASAVAQTPLVFPQSARAKSDNENENDTNNPSNDNNNHINIDPTFASSSPPDPSAIATPATTPEVSPSYNHLQPALHNSIEPPVEDHPFNHNINNNVPPPSPAYPLHDAASTTTRDDRGSDARKPSPFTASTAPTPTRPIVNGNRYSNSYTDEVAQAAGAPVVLNRKSFNFASQGAGAQILAASANAVGAKNIIVENDDKYMLAPCDSHMNSRGEGYRWVDIELSEYVIMESVQTGNFEHYSSAARKFAVLGSEHYPPSQWNTLGVFDFMDMRGMQTFNITYRTPAERKVSRFLRVVYIGKRGYEYYCPISIFRAFGKNLYADLKDGLESPLEKKQNKKDHNNNNNNNNNDEKRGKINNNNNIDLLNNNNINDNYDLNNFDRILLEDNLTALQAAHHKGNTPHDKADISRKEEGNKAQGEVKTYENGGNIPPTASSTEQEHIELTPHGSGNGNEKNTNDNHAHTAKSSDDAEEERPEPDIGYANGNDGTTTGNENGNDDGEPPDDNDDDTSERKNMSTDDQIVLDVLREETLSPVSGHDNIFRRVARMIRLLELNQSLTNQYIDTQLARFAQALAATHREQVRIENLANSNTKQVGSTHDKIIHDHNDIVHHLEQLQYAARRRDILTAILLVIIGLLCGTNWIMWSAIVAMRNVALHDNNNNRAQNNNNNVEHISSPITSPINSSIQESDNMGIMVANGNNGNGNNNTTAISTTSTSTISTTASVDGVHVQMTDVRHSRRRRRRRWTEPGNSTGVNSSTKKPPIASHNNNNNSPAKHRLTNTNNNNNNNSNSPSSRNNNNNISRLVTTNSFHPLLTTPTALCEHERRDVPPE